eukprot:TRINITY_DN2822_c1_g1_i2.p1 TRINITY_DN2822_c1_g1~~TRINITY_DN2822_c1_g1_i2.p1  ORF type:complete len:115 (+),score=14.81 TRINITY_DN2822_c1_g1_i2:39-383(+)
MDLDLTDEEKQEIEADIALEIELDMSLSGGEKIDMLKKKFWICMQKHYNWTVTFCGAVIAIPFAAYWRMPLLPIIGMGIGGIFDFMIISKSTCSPHRVSTVSYTHLTLPTTPYV